MFRKIAYSLLITFAISITLLAADRFIQSQTMSTIINGVNSPGFISDSNTVNKCQEGTKTAKAVRLRFTDKTITLVRTKTGFLEIDSRNSMSFGWKSYVTYIAESWYEDFGGYMVQTSATICYKDSEIGIQLHEYVTNLSEMQALEIDGDGVTVSIDSNLHEFDVLSCKTVIPRLLIYITAKDGRIVSVQEAPEVPQNIEIKWLTFGYIGFDGKNIQKKVGLCPGGYADMNTNPK